MAGGGLMRNVQGDIHNTLSDPNVQADTQIFDSIASHANGGNFVLLTAADSLATASDKSDWLTAVPAMASTTGNPFHSVEALQYFYDDSTSQFPDTPAGIELEAAYAPNQLARSMASDWFAQMILNGSSAIFLGGGDQWRYTACWEDTGLASTIGEKYAAGNTVVAGTSAGCAVLGTTEYASEFGACTSAEALSNAQGYNLNNAVGNPLITLQESFLDVGSTLDVGSFITDTHFGDPNLTPRGSVWGGVGGAEYDGNRDRMGRLATFLANTNINTDTPGSNGIGIDADTALVVQGDGSAEVLGQFSVYFVTAAAMPDPFSNEATNIPLTMGGIEVRAVSASAGSFALANGWNQAVKMGSQYGLTVAEGALEGPAYPT
jgi:cyanophycinase-like exopeptidase